MSACKEHGLIALGLVLLSAAALSHVCGNDFINMDDPHYVTRNDHVTAGLTIPSVGWALTTVHAGYWMPLTWLSLQLDASLYWPRYALPGSDPGSAAAWGFHLTNLLWHLGNTLLVYWLLFRWTGSKGSSALVAVLFALHPLRVESVAWVTERKDVLSTFFGLLALLAYTRYAEKPGVSRYLAVALCLGVSLLAKPMLVTLPALLLLLDWWPLARLGKVSWTRLIAEKLPLFGLALALTAVTIWTQHAVGAMSGLAELPVGRRLANAVMFYEGYLAKVFWPTELACFYPRPNEPWRIEQVLLAGLLLISITALAVAVRREVPAVLVGWLWFVIGLAPAIGLLQAGDQGMADRFTYFPLLGLILAIVLGCADLARRWQVAPVIRTAVPGLVIIGLACLTWAQVSLWKNCLTLYAHTLEVTKDNAYVHGLLGVYLFDQNDLAGAEEHLSKSLALSPGNTPEVHLYYGVVMHKKGRWREAATHLQLSVTRRPDWTIAREYLAKAVVELRKEEQRKEEP